MIRKIVQIKNVGTLADCSCKGNVGFQRLTLIFARNGLGKTTLCDILRSYQSADPSYLLGRRTLGARGDPEVELRLDGSSTRFANGAWTVTDPQILIFGTEFIEQNVYSGSAVTHEHRKNLYRVIVGEEGVRLAKDVDDLDEQIRQSSRLIAETAAAVQRVAPTGVQLQDFLALPPEENLDAKLETIGKELRSLQMSSEIARKPELSKVMLPPLPNAFRDILQRTIANISNDAATAVRKHLDTHTNGAPVDWIAAGLGYVRQPHCPFCGQSLDGQDLITSYRDFFSEAYQELTNAISRLSSASSTLADEGTIQRLARTIDSNARLADFWSQFLSLDLPTITEAQFREGLVGLREALTDAIAQKSKAPLISVTLSPEFPRDVEPLETLSQLVARYNAAIDAANAAIATQRKTTGDANPEARQSELRRLQAVKVRHSEEGKAAATAYDDALSKKSDLEQQKREAKRTLDEYSDTILATWEKDLNRLLANFGAGFQIGQVRRQYLGGSASSVYRIVINGIAVDPGDPLTPRNEPSFKNTLSAGDRAALALAFFIARIERDPNRGDKIVVFDDPFSSLDGFRRSYTQQCISRIARDARQVIILSHDAGFLKLLADNSAPAEMNAMRLSFLGGRTQLIECDLEKETAPDFNADFLKLQSFIDSGSQDLRGVARAIRPVLEGALRHRFPGEFPPGQELGVFLGRIRSAQPTDAIAAAQPVLPELEDINGFSRQYHHTNWQLEPIDEVELGVFAKRTLDFARGV